MARHCLLNAEQSVRSSFSSSFCCCSYAYSLSTVSVAVENNDRVYLIIICIVKKRSSLSGTFQSPVKHITTLNRSRGTTQLFYNNEPFNFYFYFFKTFILHSGTMHIAFFF